MKFFFNFYSFSCYLRCNKTPNYRSENKIKILNKKLLKIETQIEKLETDIAYIFSPHKLNEINQMEFNLMPIHQNNIIKLQNK